MPLPSQPRAVITGAAGGLGRALALELARRKAHLVIADINVAGSEETARLATQAGASSTKVVRCDVTKLEDVQALSSATEGTIDLVVNNAGVSSGGNVGELPIEDWRWTLNVDLWGPIHGCHVFVPRLRAQGRGHILNVSSAAGLLCAPQMAAYNVAKAGVIALSETLAAELSGSGIGVTVLCPTFIKTDIVNNGRFSDPKTRAMGVKLVSRGVEADGVAKTTLAAVDAGALYTLPMADALWGWRIKRAMPAVFHRLSARLMEKLQKGGARHAA